MKDYAGDVVRKVIAESGDRQPPASPPSAGAPDSAGRWHAAVLAASARTTHELKAADSPRDPRYTSPDPAVDVLWRALCEVADPELPVSLVDLGLITDVRRSHGHVEVDVTFTASACPCMEFIIEDVKQRLLLEQGVEHVKVTDVWDPPWTTERMTDHGRALLRSFGVAA